SGWHCCTCWPRRRRPASRPPLTGRGRREPDHRPHARRRATRTHHRAGLHRPARPPARAGLRGVRDDRHGCPCRPPRRGPGRSAGRPILEHPQDLALSGGGVMHEGAVSARLGLAGMPAAAEESAIARDLALAKLTGGRMHLCHVSTAGGVELIRRAKAGGLAITAEVTPHHLALTDEWVAGSRAFAWEDDGQRGAPYDTATKVNPPLRTVADVRACWAGLMDGTIDAIATDHAPHASIRK